ncbi:hypothetical protein ACHWQZ_G017397 [Mnemiopsis leidyi]
MLKPNTFSQPNDHGTAGVWKMRPPNGAPTSYLSAKCFSCLHYRSSSQKSLSFEFTTRPVLCDSAHFRSQPPLELVKNGVDPQQAANFSLEDKYFLILHYRSITSNVQVSDNLLCLFADYPHSYTREDEETELNTTPDRQLQNYSRAEVSSSTINLTQQKLKQVHTLTGQCPLQRHPTLYTPEVRKTIIPYLVTVISAHKYASFSFAYAAVTTCCLAYIHTRQHILRQLQLLIKMTKFLNCSRSVSNQQTFNLVLACLYIHLLENDKNYKSVSNLLRSYTPVRSETERTRKKHRSGWSVSTVPPPSVDAYASTPNTRVFSRESRVLYDTEIQICSSSHSPGSVPQREQSATYTRHELSIHSNCASRYTLNVECDRKAKKLASFRSCADSHTVTQTVTEICDNLAACLNSDNDFVNCTAHGVKFKPVATSSSCEWDHECFREHHRKSANSLFFRVQITTIKTDSRECGSQAVLSISDNDLGLDNDSALSLRTANCSLRPGCDRHFERQFFSQPQDSDADKTHGKQHSSDSTSSICSQRPKATGRRPLQSRYKPSKLSHSNEDDDRGDDRDPSKHVNKILLRCEQDDIEETENHTNKKRASLPGRIRADNLIEEPLIPDTKPNASMMSETSFFKFIGYAKTWMTGPSNTSDVSAIKTDETHEVELSLPLSPATKPISPIPTVTIQPPDDSEQPCYQEIGGSVSSPGTPACSESSKDAYYTGHGDPEITPVPRILPRGVQKSLKSFLHTPSLSPRQIIQERHRIRRHSFTNRITAATPKAQSIKTACPSEPSSETNRTRHISEGEAQNILSTCSGNFGHLQYKRYLIKDCGTHQCDSNCFNLSDSFLLDKETRKMRDSLQQEIKSALLDASPDITPGQSQLVTTEMFWHPDEINEICESTPESGS